MGQPSRLKAGYPYVLLGRQTEGTETSSYLQEEKTTVIPPVVASDRGTAQTGVVALHRRGSRTAPWYLNVEWKVLESSITEGDNPVHEHRRGLAVS